MSEVKPVWGELRASRSEPSKTAWLLSFIDLTGNLVGLFVIMFSLQVIDREAWEDLKGGFDAAFNARAAAVPVMPTGLANSMEVVAVQKDVLPYLDSLLRNRLKDDPAWQGLQGRAVEGRSGKEMVYSVPMALADVEVAENLQAWQRLSSVVARWRNPVTVRVTVLPEQELQGSALAVKLASTMAHAGAVSVAGEVTSGNMQSLQIVVRGE